MVDLERPLADATFLKFKQDLINKKLPELGTAGAAAHTAATVHIANIMTDVLKEQREARQDASDARALSKSPRSVNEFFNGRIAPRSKSVRSKTVSDAICLIGQTYKGMGPDNIRLDKFGKIDFRLSRQYRSYKKEDPPLMITGRAKVSLAWLGRALNPAAHSNHPPNRRSSPQIHE